MVLTACPDYDFASNIMQEVNNFLCVLVDGSFVWVRIPIHADGIVEVDCDDRILRIIFVRFLAHLRLS